MATIVRFEEKVDVPLGIRSLADFRRWALSEKFPEKGRIDYLDGSIEVDMSPEDVFCHGLVKGLIYTRLFERIERLSLGYLFTDATRVSSPEANWSAEPDIVFVSDDSLDTGRVKLIPKASGEEGRFVELEGTPDLVVEFVSDSSVTKDRKRLPAAYFRAGVPEFWLVDARKSALVFRIHQPGAGGYEPAPTDDEGSQYSSVMKCWYRLDRERNAKGRPVFYLREKGE